jgi:Mrp family chromosome partitioning ATPase
MIRRAAANGKAHRELRARMPAGAPGPEASLAARFASLWRSVRAACEATPLRLGVTACAPRHGVSTVAANLAITAARSGWSGVALVEANGANPSLASAFAVPQAPGIAEVLRGDAAIESCVRETAVEGLSLLPAGCAARRPALSDRDVQEILDELEREFAVIVCDLPPASFPGGLTWVGRLDGVLLVIGAGEVTADAALHAKRELGLAGARLLGVVLTNCEPAASFPPRQPD